MQTSLLAGLAVLSLLAAACSDGEGLDRAVSEVEAPESGAGSGAGGPDSDNASGPNDRGADEPTDPDAADSDSASDGGSDPGGGTTAETDDGETDGPSQEELAAVEEFAAGAAVSDDEVACLLDGMAEADIEPTDVTSGSLGTEQDLVLSNLILDCFESPESLTGFVQNFAAGFAITAGFELSPTEASCLVAGLADSEIDLAALDEPELPPELVGVVDACLGLDLGEVFEPGDTYGDNPVLDRLWDDCETGNGNACDQLYARSEIGSEYESFGATCGGRDPQSIGGVCGAPFDYGDDAALDGLWDDCEAGSGESCDRLYAESPIGSVYEAFGDTCGFRYEESPGLCQVALS